MNVSSERRQINFGDMARCSFSQDNHSKRIDRLKKMRSDLENTLLESGNILSQPTTDQNLASNKFNYHNDNPFILKGKRKLKANLNKIIPRSFSEERTNPSQNKCHFNQLLTFKDT